MRKIFILLTLVLMLAACSGNGASEDDKTVTLRGGEHDSREIHNNIAKMILENGYNYDVEVTNGSTMATFQGLKGGDIDVGVEVWIGNMTEAYEEAVDEGKVEKLSVNFSDNVQGVFVPTYVVEGDKERGIEPIAPDLETMEDLKDYPDVFEDPEEPDMGRLIGSPASWEADEILREKMTTYGLEDTINYFSPGSDAALVASLVDAYENGEPWVGYYWSPTIITAKYDLTYLEEPAYDEEIWDENKGTAFPADDVLVVANSEFAEREPDVIDFLSKYETSSDLTEDGLDYMGESDSSHEETAIWWMNEHEDIWTDWIPEDEAEKVKEALD